MSWCQHNRPWSTAIHSARYTSGAWYLWPTWRMDTSASVCNVCPSDCCCWILDYMTVVWYDGDTFFSLSAWCIEDWASERYCGYVVCLCVCLSLKPNPNDVLGIRQYIAKYRDITIPLKLGRYKIHPSIAKLYGNVYMWVGVARMLHNSDVTIVTTTVTSQC